MSQNQTDMFPGSDQTQRLRIRQVQAVQKLNGKTRRRAGRKMALHVVEYRMIPADGIYEVTVSIWNKCS